MLVVHSTPFVKLKMSSNSTSSLPDPASSSPTDGSSVSLSSSQSHPIVIPDPSSTSTSISTSTSSNRSKQLYSTSAKHFLQRQYLPALIQSTQAIHLLTSNPSPSPSPPSPLLNKLLILRLTILSTVYSQSRSSILTSLKNVSNSTPLHRDLLRTFNLSPFQFIQHLFSEILCWSNHLLLDSITVESLEPNKFTGPLILELDQGVLTSCCLAALRLDQDSSTLSSDELSKDNLSSKVVSEREMRKGEGEGLKASKLLSEWFFSSYSAIELKDLESEKETT